MQLDLATNVRIAWAQSMTHDCSLFCVSEILACGAGAVQACSGVSKHFITRCVCGLCRFVALPTNDRHAHLPPPVIFLCALPGSSLGKTFSLAAQT